jgi:hypothetical protein
LNRFGGCRRERRDERQKRKQMAAPDPSATHGSCCGSSLVPGRITSFGPARARAFAVTSRTMTQMPLLVPAKAAGRESWLGYDEGFSAGRTSSIGRRPRRRSATMLPATSGSS